MADLSEAEARAILRVDADASLSVIKTAYRRELRANHSDLRSGDEDFLREQRARYDLANRAFERLTRPPATERPHAPTDPPRDRPREGRPPPRDPPHQHPRVTFEEFVAGRDRADWGPPVRGGQDATVGIPPASRTHGIAALVIALAAIAATATVLLIPPAVHASGTPAIGVTEMPMDYTVAGMTAAEAQTASTRSVAERRCGSAARCWSWRVSFASGCRRAIVEIGTGPTAAGDPTAFVRRSIGVVDAGESRRVTFPDDSGGRVWATVRRVRCAR